ncbi:MAG: hypothetical protein KR126chlam5_01067 [Candidatus Anoxychlamydiales bacterium]|nr:hypothetical protein [Candidatus Anoxychlamydiales bacterium]
MSSLEKHLKGLNFINHLDDVNNLLNSAHPKINFRGKYVITVNGYSGKVEIDYISNRIGDYCRRYIFSCFAARTRILPSSEGKIGMEIVQKLHNLYLIGDQKYKQSNIFIKIIRVFFNIIYLGIKGRSFDEHDRRNARQIFEMCYNDNTFQRDFIPTREQLNEEERISEKRAEEQRETWRQDRMREEFI